MVTHNLILVLYAACVASWRGKRLGVVIYIHNPHTRSLCGIMAEGGG